MLDMMCLVLARTVGKNCNSTIKHYFPNSNIGNNLSHDLDTCYNKKCKNVPAPLIIDPDVLLVLLQSLSVLMSFSQIILCDLIGS